MKYFSLTYTNLIDVQQSILQGLMNKFNDNFAKLFTVLRRHCGWLEGLSQHQRFEQAEWVWWAVLGVMWCQSFFSPLITKPNNRPIVGELSLKRMLRCFLSLDTMNMKFKRMVSNFTHFVLAFFVVWVYALSWMFNSFFASTLIKQRRGDDVLFSVFWINLHYNLSLIPLCFTWQILASHLCRTLGASSSPRPNPNNSDYVAF